MPAPRHNLLILLLLFLAGLPALGAAQAVVVQGRVLSTDSLPVADASVTVAQGAVTRKTTTNKEGEYRFLFPDGGVQFFLVIRKPGYAVVSWSAGPPDPSGRLRADTLMVSTPITLPDITSIGSNTAPSSGGRLRFAVGGQEQSLVRQALLLTDPGSLDEMIASLATVFVSDSGLQILGSKADQNVVSINGNPSSAGTLPPDAIGSLRVSSSSSDVSTRFGGMLTSVASAHGSDQLEAVLRTQLLPPLLAWRDPRSPIPPQGQASVSGMLSGPLSRGQAHYHLSFVENRRRSNSTSLSHLDPALADEVGLSPDTVLRFRNALESLHLPFTPLSQPQRNTSRNGSAYLTVDFQAGASADILVTINPRWQRSVLSPSSPYSLSTRGLRTGNNGLSVGARSVSYLAGGVDEIRLSLDRSSNFATPLSALPSGTVLVGVAPPTGQAGITSLSFGGAGSTNRSWRTQLNLNHDWSITTPDATHQIRLGQQAELIWYRSRNDGGPGGYQFPSLDALETNDPSAFSQFIDGVEERNRTFSLAGYAGDLWRISDHMTLEAGTRVDYSRFAPAPGANPELAARFGLHSERTPVDLAFSPRIGFAWELPVKRMPTPTYWRDPESNQLRKIVALVGNPSGLVGVERGNSGTPRIFTQLGVYQAPIGAQRLAAMRRSTGLPGSIGTYQCTGDEIAPPDWTFPAADPCLGDPHSSFTSLASSISVFGPGFRPPRAIRATMGLVGINTGMWSFRADLALSWNRHVESRLNANLAEPAFTLPGEGGRPVFVPAAAISPTTGMIAPAANRRFAEFGAVQTILSDLNGRAGFISVQGTTQNLVFNIPVQFQYSLNYNRTQIRGLGGDPYAIATVPGSQPTHQLMLTSLGYRIWWFSLTAGVTLSSGRAFTPLVMGDVNGDGVPGDLAWIPPSRGTSSPLTSAMQELRKGLPGSIRHCLDRQSNQVAAFNSCCTGWHANLNLDLQFNPPQRVGLTRDLSLGVGFLNVMSAAARLLGASGLLANPMDTDPNLLYLTGFDPATRSYTYRVNPQFGRPRSTPRTLAPFQVTLSAQYRFGSRQQVLPALSLLDFDPSVRNSELAADTLLAAVRRRLVHEEPVRPALLLRDSLALNQEQVEALVKLDAAFQASLDSLAVPIATAIKAYGDRLTITTLTSLLNPGYKEIIPRLKQSRLDAMAVLTLEQRWKMGWRDE